MHVSKCCSLMLQQFLKWKLMPPHSRAVNAQCLAEGLAPQVAQPDPPAFFWPGKIGSTRNLAHFLAVSLNLVSGRARCRQFKTRKHAMHLSTRANTFHNLLAYIASLGKVQRALLTGFLRQIALADVFTKQRNPCCHSIEPLRRRAHSRRSSFLQRFGQGTYFFRPHPNLVSLTLPGFRTQ